MREKREGGKKMRRVLASGSRVGVWGLGARVQGSGFRA
jgi:hypothetical protein